MLEYRVELGIIESFYVQSRKWRLRNLPNILKLVDRRTETRTWIF